MYNLLLHAMAWRQLKILKGKQSGVGLGGLRRCSKHFINTSSTLPGSVFALKLKRHYQFISKSLPQSSYLHSMELKKVMSLQSFCTSLQTEVVRQRTSGIFDWPTFLMGCLRLPLSFYPPSSPPGTWALPEPHSWVLLSTGNFPLKLSFLTRISNLLSDIFKSSFINSGVADKEGVGSTVWQSIERIL